MNLNFLTILNTARRNCLNLITINSKKNYSRSGGNILRNRYYKKRNDGSSLDYNETITIVPKELEEQGSYVKG